MKKLTLIGALIGLFGPVFLCPYFLNLFGTYASDRLLMILFPFSILTLGSESLSFLAQLGIYLGAAFLNVTLFSLLFFGVGFLISRFNRKT